ncbi:MAG: DUF2273 domain-containing protein [Clostridia bacterium]|nr:DUF2273 domain-containing protein [Clostridia bacterium]
MFRRLYKFYRTHYYGVNGAIIGLLVGLSFVFIGPFQTIFIALCIFAGYWLGKKLQKDKDFIRKLLDKILPPGSYR